MKKEQKPKKQTLKNLINEAVEDVLLEEQLQINEDVLTKAFIEPFTDVFKTAKAGLEKTITSVAGNARKVALQLGVAAMPFVASSEVTRIGEEEAARINQKLSQIDDKYSDVLRRNIDALRQKDAAGLAFFFNPAVAIGAHAGAWAAGKGIGTASAGVAWNLDLLAKLTSGVPAISNQVETLKGKFETLSTKASDAASKIASKPIYDPGFSGSGVLGMGDGGGDFGESVSSMKSVLKEQPQQFTTDQLNQKMGQVVSQLLRRKDVQAAIQNSDMTKMIKVSAIESVVDRANKIAAFSKLDQFGQFSGSQVKDFISKVNSQLPKDLTPEQKAQYEQEAVAALKKSYRQVYEKYLRNLAAKSPGLEKELQAASRSLQKLG